MLALRVPEGAVPPGPAEAEIVSGALGPAAFRARFHMPAHGEARLRIPFTWAPSSSDETSLVVRVTGAHGAVYRRRIPQREVREHDSPTTPLFIGDAAGLGELVDALRRHAGPATGDDHRPPLGEVRLGGSEALENPDCRSLARAAVVVADRPGRGAEALERCAARGARVVIVDPALDGGSNRSVHWGAGILARAANLEDAAVLARESATVSGRFPVPFGTGLVQQGAYAWQSARSGDREGASDTVVLACLLGYVLVLGPLGWLVLRRRNTLLSWLYFPAVALVATAALWVATLGADADLDRAEVQQTVIAAPDGTGLALVAVRIDGTQTTSFTVETPWRDADLQQVARPFRFGSPFTTPAGSIDLAHDLDRDTLRASGVAVSRWSEAGLSWAVPVRIAVPRIERVQLPGGHSGDRLELVAAADAPTRVALVGTSEGWALLTDLAPGERRVVSLGEPADDIRADLVRRKTGLENLFDMARSSGEFPANAVLVLSDVRDDANRDVRITPRVPVERRSLRLMVGARP